MTRLLQLLVITPELRDKENWLRSYYADIWTVGNILFGQGTPKNERKRLLRELQGKWVANMRRLDDSPDDPVLPFLVEAFGVTQSQFYNLFHCYTNPRIPATNNGTERLLAVLKALERQLAKNPNPGARFIRNAPTEGLLLNLKTLPGEAFIGTRTPEDMARVRVFLREASRQAGVAKLARRDLPDLMNRIRKRWRGQTLAAESPPTMETSPTTSS
ncbi:MAG: hypothetical protein HY297_03235 [Thaumarchaeota archaeon]|nr:hypothetical protein [Nitrososphaerota archaeon]